jgi:hypothetical protein
MSLQDPAIFHNCYKYGFSGKMPVWAAFSSLSGKSLPDHRADETQRLSVASCLITYQTQVFIEMLHIGNKNFLNIFPGVWVPRLVTIEKW